MGQGFRWPRDSTGRLEALMPVVDSLHDILIHKFVNCRDFCISHVGEPGDRYEQDQFRPSDAIEILFAISARSDLHFEYFEVGKYSGPGMGDLGLSPINPNCVSIPPNASPGFLTSWSHLEMLRLD